MTRTPGTKEEVVGVLLREGEVERVAGVVIVISTKASGEEI